jgi:hypothetical protein
MKAIVICPDHGKVLPFFTQKTPAALVPMHGHTLLSHALTMLAEAGATEVIVLAADRPEQVRRAVMRGERWGLTVHVVPESRELSVEEARAKHRPPGEADWLPAPQDVVTADGPNPKKIAPLAEAADWFAALEPALPLARKHRVGVREIEPGVWAGLRVRIEQGVKFQAPCWLGEGVWVRAAAKIGPGAFIEDEVMIDHDATVSESWVGPHTYVGAMTHVHRSLAWGNRLLNYHAKSFLEVPDAFLLSELRPTRDRLARASVFGRLLAMGVGLATSPVALLAWWRSRSAKIEFCRRRRAMVPICAGTLVATRDVEYREFPCLRGLWRRWPQLWSIVRGDFAWIGNRPITHEQVKELTSEFEQLWLAAPVGLFSLADAEGSPEVFDDETRAHASFYAAQSSAKMDRQILGRLLRRTFFPSP